MRNHNLLFAAAAFSTLASAQDPGAPIPLNFEISKVGETLIRSTVAHRSKMMNLQRQLEIETAEGKVAQAKADKARIDLAAQGTIGADVIPIVPVNRTAALPPDTSSVRGGQATTPASSDEPARPLDTSTVIKFVSPPVIPSLSGIIGNRGVFRVGGDQVEAVAGQSVGLFTVVQIDQTSAVLVENSDKKNRVTLQVLN